MEEVLTAGWLGDDESVAVLDEASVAVVRDLVRDVSAGRLPTEATDSLVLVASELAHNQRRHAAHGRVAVAPIERAGVPGVEIIAADRGPGLREPTAALRGGSPPSGGLGVGLQAVRRLAQEVDVDVRVGEGTCLRARVFATRPAHRSEVGIYGRPIPEETMSGDTAAFIRHGSMLWALVSDGLGHGPAARDASDRAVAAFLALPLASPAEVLAGCNERMLGTRGGVAAALRLDASSGKLDTAIAGNIEGGVYGRQPARRFTGTALVLGAKPGVRKLTEETTALGPREAVVLCSDGIARRPDADADRELILDHPVVIAEALVRAHARATDDAIVVVVK